MLKTIGKRTLITAFVLLTLLIPARALDFPDVPGHWAEQQIDYWTDRGIIKGYPDGSFLPDGTITRAEAATLISGLLEVKGSGNTAFSDLDRGAWYYRGVDACVSHQIFYGYSATEFAPGNSITRAEAVTVLSRITDFAPAEDAVLDFTDTEEIPRWAMTAMKTMVAAGIVSGYPDGTVQPKSPVTRAEFVAMLYRIENSGTWQTPPEIRDVESAGTFYWQKDDNAATRVETVELEGEIWLLLPSAADKTALSLTDTLSLDNLTWSGNLGKTQDAHPDVTALASQAPDGSYALTVTGQQDGVVLRRRLRLIFSERIGSMYLTSTPDSGGRAYVEEEKGNAIKGSMALLTPEGDVRYDGALSQIKSRGNSTFSRYPKKSYQIKLDKKTDLLDNGQKVKTWVLLAEYADPSKFRDKLCKDLAADFGQPGTPDCDWLDLYFDGEYRGTYVLSEKVQIGSTGLDITDLEGLYEDCNQDYGKDVVTASGVNRFGNAIHYVEGLTDPEDLTNGYLLELNNTTGDENCWFKTTWGRGVNVKVPENASRAALTYISEFYQEFEDAVYAVDSKGNATGVNPRTGKSFDAYCDLDSLADMYLLYLFSENQDAYLQSTFFYMENGILHAGPIWDSDQTFGIGWGNPISSSHGIWNEYLAHALEKLPAFEKKVAERYNTAFRVQAQRYALEQIGIYESVLTGSCRLDRLLWPTYYKTGNLSKYYEEDATYPEICQDIARWMLERIGYMDGQFHMDQSSQPGEHRADDWNAALRMIAGL